MVYLYKTFVRVLRVHRFDCCLQPHHATVFERNVYVSKSKIHRFGLFARNDILPKDIICLYSGVRRDEPIEGNVFTCRIKSTTDDTPDYYIDSNDPQNYCGRWMNHGDSPNARLVIPLGGVIRCPDKEKCAILVECKTKIKDGQYTPTCFPLHILAMDL